MWPQYLNNRVFNRAVLLQFSHTTFTSILIVCYHKHDQFTLQGLPKPTTAQLLCGTLLMQTFPLNTDDSKPWRLASYQIAFSCNVSEAPLQIWPTAPDSFLGPIVEIQSAKRPHFRSSRLGLRLALLQAANVFLSLEQTWRRPNQKRRKEGGGEKGREMERGVTA